MQDLLNERSTEVLVDFIRTIVIILLGYILTQRGVHQYTRNKYFQESKNELMDLLTETGSNTMILHEMMKLKDIPSTKLLELLVKSELSFGAFIRKLLIYTNMSEEYTERLGVTDTFRKRYVDFAYKSIDNKPYDHEGEIEAYLAYSTLLNMLDTFIMNLKIKL